MAWVRSAWIVFVLIVEALAGCTRENPSATCKDGVCSDHNYPFCDVDGTIGGDPGACIAVSCTGGDFAGCQGSDALICSESGLNYDVVSCGGGCNESGCVCSKHSDCPTGVCMDSGVCALARDIAFVAPSGDPASSCTEDKPCTLGKALALPVAAQQYVHLAAGSYALDTTLVVEGKRTLVGSGPDQTSITSTATGTLFSISAAANATFDNLSLSGTVPSPGVAVDCTMSSAPSTVTVVRSKVQNNSGPGVNAAGGCQVRLLESVFRGNYDGADLASASSLVDRCVFSNSIGTGLAIVNNNTFRITNSFAVRNRQGMLISISAGTGVFDFNTIVDNMSAGVSCKNSNIAQPAKNNIIARNATNVMTTPSPCSYPGTIQATDVTALRFVAPDAAAFDYHLTAGSSAIGVGVTADDDHDFDGDARPSSTGFDVGADQFHAGP